MSGLLFGILFGITLSYIFVKGKEVLKKKQIKHATGTLAPNQPEVLVEVKPIEKPKPDPLVE